MVRGKGRSGRILWSRIREIEKAEPCLTTGELDRVRFNQTALFFNAFLSQTFSLTHLLLQQAVGLGSTISSSLPTSSACPGGENLSQVPRPSWGW